MVGISSLLLFCSHLLSGRRFCVFLDWYNVMTCSASVAGTAMVGMRTQGKVVIVDMPKLGDVINPRLTAMTRSAIPNTFQTTRAYSDQLYPLQENGERDRSYSNQNVSDPVWYCHGRIKEPLGHAPEKCYTR